MMKRLLPYFLIIIFCLGSTLVKAQDSTKTTTEEKKAPEVKSAPAKSTPATNAAKGKPVKHSYHKLKPAPGPVIPATIPATDTTKAVPLKTQVDPTQLNAKSLTAQYQYLLTKTYNYQQPLISALWKNFTDTLGETRSKLKAAQIKAASQSKLIDSLKTLSASKEQTLNESNAKADAISLFGLTMSKSSYNLLMFGLVAVLGIALFIVIATTAKNKHEAKYRTELYDELDEEFKAFKAKAHEKELKLARELQTERNKVDELMGRG
ncbi:MAG: hypothetical protein ACHQHN_12465 [Sphingobacteriales bacterium]